jgi:segregation and condensation protein B
MSIHSQLESLLFVAGRSLNIKELSKLLKEKPEKIKDALNTLGQDYKENNRGLRLICNNDKYQLSTAGENSDLVAKLLKEEFSGELTRPSLEALTIIAYRQPVSKLEIEKIRGVNCSLILRNLLLRGLIEEKFDKNKEENYYSVSLDFLANLGLDNVAQLPDFDKLSVHKNLNSVLSDSSQ